MHVYGLTDPPEALAKENAVLEVRVGTGDAAYAGTAVLAITIGAAHADPLAS